MFKFEEVTYLYKLDGIPSEEGVERVNTSIGYMTLDNKELLCQDIYSMNGCFLLYYFVRNEETLYLMKKEPVYYV